MPAAAIRTADLARTNRHANADALAVTCLPGRTADAVAALRGAVWTFLPADGCVGALVVIARRGLAGLGRAVASRAADTALALAAAANVAGATVVVRLTLRAARRGFAAVSIAYGAVGQRRATLHGRVEVDRSIEVDSSAEIRPEEARLVEVGAGDVCAAEVRALQTSLGEGGAGEVRIGEVGLLAVDATEVDAAHLTAGEVSSGEIALIGIR